MKSLKRSSLIATALLFAGVSFVTPVLPTDQAKARSVSTCNSQWVSAHRGETSRTATENTLPAFNLAINRGAKAVETDLRLTKDGYWVLMHDSTVDRTTRSKGAIANMTFAKAMTVKSNSGHKILSFKRFVKEMPSSIKFQLEFKSTNPSNEKLQEVVDILRAKTSNPSQVFLTSSQRGVLQRLSVIAPEYERGLIMGQRRSLPASQIPSYVDSINVHYAVASASYINAVHNRGKRVLTRSAESPSAWQRVIRLNSDRIVTDNITGYTKWCRSVR